MTTEETASARGVYRMRTGSKDVSRYQVRVWISKKHLGAKERKAGKRVHLGCFKTLSTSTYVYDVVTAYFKGRTSQTSARVCDSPILKFLLETIEDRSDLKEFRNVWRHLMRCPWVFDVETVSAERVADKLGDIARRIRAASEEAAPCALETKTATATVAERKGERNDNDNDNGDNGAGTPDKSSRSGEDHEGRSLDRVPSQSEFVMGRTGPAIPPLGPARTPSPQNQYCNQFNQYNQLLMAINLEMFRKSLLGQV